MQMSHQLPVSGSSAVCLAAVQPHLLLTSPSDHHTEIDKMHLGVIEKWEKKTCSVCLTSILKCIRQHARNKRTGPIQCENERGGLFLCFCFGLFSPLGSREELSHCTGLLDRFLLSCSEENTHTNTKKCPLIVLFFMQLSFECCHSALK